MAARSSTLGQRLGRGLLMLGVLGGALIALERNDLLLAAARSLGFEAKYLSFESASMGGPGSGTPRALAPLIARSRAWFEHLEGPETAVNRTASVTPANAPSTAATADAPPTGADRAVPAEPATSADGVKVVSLDALPVLDAKPSAPVPAAPRGAPEAVALRAREPAPKAVVAAREPAPKKAAPMVVQREEQRTEEPKPKKVASAPAAPAAPDNPLKAAIRSAILKESNP